MRVPTGKSDSCHQTSQGMFPRTEQSRGSGQKCRRWTGLLFGFLLAWWHCIRWLVVVKGVIGDDRTKVFYLFDHPDEQINLSSCPVASKVDVQRIRTSLRTGGVINPNSLAVGGIDQNTAVDNGLNQLANAAVMPSIAVGGIGIMEKPDKGHSKSPSSMKSGTSRSRSSSP